MRLLLDMGLPRRSAELLRDAGHDAVHIGERGLSRLADDGILALAREEGRIVITLDADFAALLALSRAASPSVVHLRMEGLGREEATRVVLAIIRAIEDDLLAGCIASVNAAGIRVRHLPIR